MGLLTSSMPHVSNMRCEQSIRFGLDGRLVTDVAELRRSLTMPMDVSDILPGKCYVASSREKYTVVDINRGIVIYKSWTTGRCPA